jgi:hypothetical protein
MNDATRKEKEKLLRIRMTKLQTMWGSHIPLDNNWRQMHQLTNERLDEDLTNAIDQLRFEKTLNIITATGKVALLAFVALAVVLLLFVITRLSG